MTLRTGECHVWLSPVLPFDEEPLAFDWLKDDEIARAYRFRSLLHRRQFLTGRWLLRNFATQYLDADPASLSLIYADAGKPSFSGGLPLQFSISHSGATVGVAFAMGVTVGFDIECGETHGDELSLARLSLPAEELAQIEAADETTRRRVFLRLWTAGEARAKATGEGLFSKKRPTDGLSVQSFDLGTRGYASIAMAHHNPLITFKSPTSASSLIPVRPMKTPLSPSLDRSFGTSKVRTGGQAE